MTHPTRPAALGALLLAAGASVATSEDTFMPAIEAEPLDGPAFDLDAEHPSQAFVVTTTPNADALQGGRLGGGEVTLHLTLKGVGPDGPAAALRISFEQPLRDDEPTSSLDSVGVAPGETRDLSVSFDLFEECVVDGVAPLAGCPEDIVVGFEHLGGADVEVTWQATARAHFRGSDAPPKGAAIELGIAATSSIPD